MGKVRIKLHVHHKDCIEHLFRSSWPHVSLSLANAGVTSSGSTPASFSQVQPDIMCPMLLASPPGVSLLIPLPGSLRKTTQPLCNGRPKLCGVPMGKALTNGGWEPMEGNLLLSFCPHPWKVFIWLAPQMVLDPAPSCTWLWLIP